jgi:transcriptional regulator with XRE-family HTH domain
MVTQDDGGPSSVESRQESSRTTLTTAFGHQLRLARKQLGISQEELAGRAGLDRTFVGRVERGDFRTTLENAQALALGCEEELWQLLKRASDSK